jgi:transcriptional regulator with XRE-family HTH domain
MARQIPSRRWAYLNILIASRLLDAAARIHYSSTVSTTRWGEAITRLLAERGWTKRQLADAASVRPNTLTNLIKHGKESDTATLSRIAAALNVDLAELFLTKEQSIVLQTHRETRVERLKELVVRELSDTVTRLVAKEMEQAGRFPESLSGSGAAKSYLRKRKRKRASGGQ